MGVVHVFLNVQMIPNRTECDIESLIFKLIDQWVEARVWNILTQNKQVFLEVQIRLCC